jgi:hypothetical protein
MPYVLGGAWGCECLTIKEKDYERKSGNMENSL